MADDPKPAKKAPAKAKATEDGVLGSLPATRPNRLSRRGRADADAPVATAKPKPKAAPTTKAAAKAKPKPKKPQLKAVPTPADAKPPKPRAVRAATANLREPAATANEN